MFIIQRSQLIALLMFAILGSAIAVERAEAPEAPASAYKVICVEVLPHAVPLPEVCVVDPTGTAPNSA